MGSFEPMNLWKVDIKPIIMLRYSQSFGGFLNPLIKFHYEGPEMERMVLLLLVILKI